MTFPQFLVDFINKENLLSLILASVLFIIITIEIWRSIKWLFTRVCYTHKKPQQASLSPSSPVEVDSPQDKFNSKVETISEFSEESSSKFSPRPVDIKFIEDYSRLK